VSGTNYMTTGNLLGEGAYFARQCATSMAYSGMHSSYRAPALATAPSARAAGGGLVDVNVLLEKEYKRYRRAIGVAEIRTPTDAERVAAALECKTRLKESAKEERQVTDFGWAVVVRKSPWVRMRWVITVF